MKQVRKLNHVAAKIGFTLIELSIVLVIIGLIVGGILVGQDLIKAAEIRATVSQLEKYSTAVNTFRGKYNGLPGDLLNAGNFGFDTTRGPGANGTDGNSDGDGLMESGGNGAAGTFAGEVACFWDDLWVAGLISENLNNSDGCGAVRTINPIVSAVPITKLGRNNYVLVGSTLGVNYWGVTGITSITGGVEVLDKLLTPAEAFQLDSKLDDGAGTSGSVQAMDATDGASLWNTVEGAGTCIGTAGSYNFGTNSGATQACALRMRSSF